MSSQSTENSGSKYSLVALSFMFFLGRMTSIIERSELAEQDKNFNEVELSRKMEIATEINPNEYLVQGVEESRSGLKLSTEKIVSEFEKSHPKVSVIGVLPAEKVLDSHQRVKLADGSLVFFVKSKGDLGADNNLLNTDFHPSRVQY